MKFLFKTVLVLASIIIINFQKLHAQWSLTGNTGTNPPANFLGTIDAKQLMFKVNGKKAGLLDYDVTKGTASFGYQSLNVNTGSNNTAAGYSSLYSNTNGTSNTAMGNSTLYSNLSGAHNTAMGYQALYYNTGSWNIAVGSFALDSNTTGSSNTASGYKSLYNNKNGSNNTATGRYAAYSNKTGSYNAAHGAYAGQNSVNGSKNVFVGYNAGSNITDGSNNIFIGADTKGSATVTNTVAIGYNVSAIQSNTIILGTGQKVGIGTSAPVSTLDLIGGNWDLGTTEGDFRIGNSMYRLKIGVAVSGAGAGDARIRPTGGSNRIMIGVNDALSIDGSGNVGIGDPYPSYKLDVCGTIRAKELRVETGWCDYVFDKDYKLLSLSEVENFIKVNKHLPDVTPGSEVETNGLQVGKVSSQMIKKIEELTLYIIQQEKSINILKEYSEKLEAKMNALTRKGGE